MQDQERRNGTQPVPDDAISFMNDEQKMAFRNLESFGWRIKFIRRPLFQRPVCVLTNPEETEIAVLEEDGTVNKNPDIVIR